jgi:hypothetical protein
MMSFLESQEKKLLSFLPHQKEVLVYSNGRSARSMWRIPKSGIQKNQIRPKSHGPRLAIDFTGLGRDDELGRSLGKVRGFSSRLSEQ